MPRLSARSRAIRVRAPPRRSRQRARAPCPSMVTALATRRPPAGRAAQQASTTPSAVTPPPTNTASGRGSPDSAAGAEPGTTTRPGTPSAAALRAMRSRRSARGSTAMARLAGWTRIHSMPMLPEPAPTSHSSWPGTGASAANASARTSCLVICPSCSNASSGRPGIRGSGAVPGSRRHSIATMASRLCGRPSAGATTSCSLPRSASTVTGLGPNPRASSRARMSAAAVGSAVRARTRRPGCSSGCSSSRGRPTRLTTSTSSSGQPRRAAATETEEGWGSTTRCAAGRTRTRVAPMP